MNINKLYKKKYGPYQDEYYSIDMKALRFLLDNGLSPHTLIEIPNHWEMFNIYESVARNDLIPLFFISVTESFLNVFKEYDVDVTTRSKLGFSFLDYCFHYPLNEFYESKYDKLPTSLLSDISLDSLHTIMYGVWNHGNSGLFRYLVKHCDINALNEFNESVVYQYLVGAMKPNVRELKLIYDNGFNQTHTSNGLLLSEYVKHYDEDMTNRDIKEISEFLVEKEGELLLNKGTKITKKLKLINSFQKPI